MADELPTTCRRCGEFLIRLGWNTRVDVLTCDNAECSLYRVPVESIGRRITLAHDLAVHVRRRGGRAKSARQRKIDMELEVGSEVELSDEAVDSQYTIDLQRLRDTYPSGGGEPDT